MAILHLDDRFARTIARPEKGSETYNDDKISGFEVRVYPDRMVGTLRYRPIGSAVKKRAFLGEHPGITMAVMRSNAEAIRGRVKGGADPAAERAAVKEERRRKETEEVLTVRKAVELYEPDVRQRKSSWDQDIGHLTRNLIAQMGERSLGSIAKADCAQRVKEVAVAAPVSANRLRAAMLTFFQWATDQGLITANPMSGIPKPTRERKQEVDRTLSDAEFVVLWRAIENAKLAPGLKAALQVLALTGQRPNEVAGLQRSDLYFLDEPGEAYAEIPADRMKGRRKHVWPISPAVAAIIQAQIVDQEEQARIEGRTPGEHIFASRFLDRQRIARHSLSQALRRIIPALDANGNEAEIVKRLQSDPPTPHAFRRTCVTGMARLKIPREDRKAVVAHREDDVLSGHYDAYERLDEKRIALNKWAQHVDALLSGQKRTGATILPIRAAAVRP
ncbi:hypothetical protein ASC97_15490 [Rhizobium sp. Root1203]|uniref:tyrosine-type recombinase/integrase n=1 Tax=Rhizobium sp. Root1203 TaxID=1736427 RepID=UPI00070FEAFB|nr:tyrosine-type recombinase/integrase [Rhizobium sp. Root1203]KQV11324.1 hypothetical protein ASC97_15490 [Rhizobium sp. Root1203]